jgi:hypothetical protein
LEGLNAQIAEAEFEGNQTFRQLSDTLGYAEALAGATGRRGGSTSSGAVAARARNDIVAYAGADMSLAGTDGVYGTRMNFLKNSVIRLVGEDMVMGGAEGDYERTLGAMRTSITDRIGEAMDLQNLGGSLGADVGDIHKKLAGLVGEDMVMGGEAEGEYERQLAGYRNDIIRLVGEDMVMGGAEGDYERELGQFGRDMQQLTTNLGAEYETNKEQLGVWKETLAGTQETIDTQTETIKKFGYEKNTFIQQLKDMYPDLYEKYGLFDTPIMWGKEMGSENAKKK